MKFIYASSASIALTEPFSGNSQWLNKLFSTYPVRNFIQFGGKMSKLG